jgi:hypothetical protein
MKESTKKMLMYGAIILIVIAIVYFLFFRNKDAEHKKETESSVKNTLEKVNAAKEMSKDKDPITQAKVEEGSKQAIQTAVVADQMKHDNPEQAKEVAKVADQQSTVVVATAAQISNASPIPNAPPMAPSGINTGIGMAQFDVTKKYAPVVDELKAELARRGGPIGEAFRYRYYRRRATLDSIKQYFEKNKTTIINKFNTLKSALKLIGIDLCVIINDRKQLSKLIKKNIKLIISKAASLPLVGARLADALSLGDDENDKSDIIISFVKDTLLGFYDDNVKILSKKIDCDDDDDDDDEKFRYNRYNRYDWDVGY